MQTHSEDIILNEISQSEKHLTIPLTGGIVIKIGDRVKWWLLGEERMGNHWV